MSRLIEQNRWNNELKNKHIIADTRNINMGHLETIEGASCEFVLIDLYISIQSYDSESIFIYFNLFILKYLFTLERKKCLVSSIFFNIDSLY